jgi:hypothetical protein
MTLPEPPELRCFGEADVCAQFPLVPPFSSKT